MKSKKKTRLLLAVLVLAALGLADCSTSSSAMIHFLNIGTLRTRVTVQGTTAILDPAGEETFGVSWAGRRTNKVTVGAYPVSDDTRNEFYVLELHNGDLIERTVNFQ